MRSDDARRGGQTDIDRLAEAARRIVAGESPEAIARSLRCPLADIQALADQLVEAGLGTDASETLQGRWAPWFARVLRGLFVRQHPESAGDPPGGELWSAWRPLASAAQLEVRLRPVRISADPAAAPLWAYEFRSQSLFMVSFRYRIDTEAGNGFPRRVRGLRPGEFYGGMTVTPGRRPPQIDAVLLEPAPITPAPATAAEP